MMILLYRIKYNVIFHTAYIGICVVKMVYREVILYIFVPSIILVYSLEVPLGQDSNHKKKSIKNNLTKPYNLA